MVICKCDGCDKEAPAVFVGDHWIKPSGWFQRDVSAQRHTYGGVDDSGFFKAPTVIIICSKECASLVVDKFKKFLTL